MKTVNMVLTIRDESDELDITDDIMDINGVDAIVINPKNYELQLAQTICAELSLFDKASANKVVSILKS
tara:strand:- start:322 stop:528 length:207 start_codon:yes stop_codon:yes gene_type:complete